MTKNHTPLALLVVLASTFSATVRAQDQPAAKSPPIAQLKVQIVLSKYQGDKKISSMPYTLSVSSERGTRASVRMGAQVPILMGPSADGKTPASFSYSYKDVGTNIDCMSFSVDSEGRYKLEITIEDSSVYAEGAAQVAVRAGDHPSFRSFRTTDVLILRDGQSAQYSSATDKVSGEVVKVDVTLTVVR